MNAEAVVIGGGIGGLNAAYQLAKAGLKPILIEARSKCGGLIAGARLADIPIDIGAESYARRSTYCRELCAEHGLETREPGGRSWLWSADDRVFPLPHGVLGIPTDLDDPEVQAAISPEGIERARRDLDLGTRGAELEDLASLVRFRLGEEVYQGLVRPVAGGIYSSEPETLTTDVVIPGLRSALTQTGSLIGAAARLRAQAPPGAVVSSVVGGMFLLPEAMSARIVELGGQVLTRTIATKVERHDQGWLVSCANASPGRTPADPPVASDQRFSIATSRVIVAADGRVGMDLLRPIPELQIGDWTLPTGAKVAHVVLALRHRELDLAPRGSGLLVAPRTNQSRPIGAKALTHLSMKWPWLLDNQPDGDRVHHLRVSYGRPGEDTNPSVEQGLSDASTLLGIDLDQSNLVASMVVHWNESLPPPTPTHRQLVAKLNSRLTTLNGLGVTGAWVAGNGLASVLTHAHREADRLRL